MKSSLEKIITGFLIGMGICIAILSVDFLKKTYWANKQQSEFVNNPTTIPELDVNSLVVTNSRLVTLSRNITIAVQIENKLKIAIGGAVVVAKLFDDEGLFGECRSYIQKLGLGEKRDFIVECSEFNSRSFPKNVKHEIEIRDINKYGL